MFNSTKRYSIAFNLRVERKLLLDLVQSRLLTLRLVPFLNFSVTKADSSGKRAFTLRRGNSRAEELVPDGRGWRATVSPFIHKLAMAQPQRFPTSISRPAAVDNESVSVNETALRLVGQECDSR